MMGNRLEFQSAFVAGLPQGLGLEYLGVKFAGEDADGPFASFFYLTAKNSKFVKLRLRIRMESAIADAIASEIADSYADLLWPAHATVRAKGGAQH